MQICPNCHTLVPKDLVSEDAIRLDERKRVLEMLRAVKLKIPLEIESYRHKEKTDIRIQLPMPFFEKLLS